MIKARRPYKLRKILVIDDDEKLVGYYRELLTPYGEWGGLASVYLLSGFARGLVPLPARHAA